ncbi:Signal transduction histidine kinase [Lishizhenia tianjinensis]|uniref:histidine kinase n=1 Tax=Lishizhenia tianjinensis TaxID=477690 RepID=A0A1I7BPD3_9FLAO|nr:HAMP domain-containing sensor histidine kinase [Lishizhenia tianjinensis]SFT89044.1 Signal transduction histidine kinase [Lishizhenia tianjinensis]
MNLRNKILIKQIERLAPDQNLSEWEPLFHAVDRVYEQLHTEVRLLEEIANKMVDDMTDANKNLERINESLDGFNYHVSHDLKSRFMNTQSLVMILKKYVNQPGQEDKVNEICEKLEWNSEKAIETVNEFLEISRLEYENEEKRIEICDIAECITNQVESINGLLYKHIQLDLDAFDKIHFDKTSLNSVLRNILTNAIKYKKEDEEPRIEIKTSFNFDHPMIIIRDHGIGLDTEILGDELFKPFNRFKNSKFIEGNGVGLFLIRKTMESGGGSVSIYGKENEGVTLSLKFKKDAVR